MPRQVTAYLCDFRCGSRAYVSRKAIEQHELTCALNPARKACKTCAHNIVERSEEPEFERGMMTYPGHPGSFGCEVDALQNGTTMAVNCHSWAKKAAEVKA